MGNIAEKPRPIPQNVVDSIVGNFSHIDYYMRAVAYQTAMFYLKKVNTPSPADLEILNQLYNRLHNDPQSIADLDHERKRTSQIVDHWLSRPSTRSHLSRLLKERGVMLLPQQLTTEHCARDLNRYIEAENICTRAMRMIIQSSRPTQ